MSSSVWSFEQKLVQKLLRSLRNNAGLTQNQLAKKLGKPQSYVSKYESGERRLDIIEIREVVILCNTNLVSFVELLDLGLSTKNK